MHYTSTENIHKVIDPLFFDDLRGEFLSIKNSARNRRKNLLALQDKIAALKFFDPACGSGNFLTETYIQLRRLENDILKELLENKIILGELDDPIKVSIQNFYGIEINNFAVVVAQTALWIAELKMKRETEEIVHKGLDLFPLKTYANIHEANALRIDWQNFAPEVDYIISNPPFVGNKFQSAAQKADLLALDKRLKPLDYVTGWYEKVARLMTGTTIKAAFVSTNSITQGEQVTPLWRKIFDEYNVQIIFGHRTFKWDSESFNKAAIHCVIVGMADKNLDVDKKIFDGDKVYPAQNINPYLVDAPTIFIESRAKHYQDFVPEIGIGNKPIDGGNYLFTLDEMKTFIRREPAAKKYFFQWFGAREFLYNEPRYCLLLKDCPPNELRKMKLVYERVQAVKNFRLASKSAPTQKIAETPTRFHVENFPTTNYLLIPSVSSENRQYLPMGFMSPNVIASNLVLIIPDAQIYHFGMLTSSIHMAWMRTVAGRLKSDYRYSGSVVYNNFPWCEPSESQRRAIEQSAQNILDVRKNYPQSTLADLYDELTMPKDLRDAHKKNDRAVAVAYGFENILDDEPKIVAELMKLYERLIKV